MQNEAEIQRVMRETGMGHVQAYHHVQQRLYLLSHRTLPVFSLPVKLPS